MDDLLKQILLEPANDKGSWRYELVMIGDGVGYPLIPGEHERVVIGEDPHTYSRRTLLMGFDVATGYGYHPQVNKVVPLDADDFVSIFLGMSTPFNDETGHQQCMGIEMLPNFMDIVEGMGGARMLGIQYPLFEAIRERFDMLYAEAETDLTAADQCLEQYSDLLFGEDRKPVTDEDVMAYFADIPAADGVNPQVVLSYPPLYMLLVPGVLLARLCAYLRDPEVLNIAGEEGNDVSA